MPFDGFAIEDLIQIVVLFLFIGAPILRAIYNALVKPVKKAVERQARSSNPPPQLQNFLDEVRRERESRQTERSPQAKRAPEGYEPWEDVEQAPARVQAPPQPRRARQPSSAPTAPAAPEPSAPEAEPQMLSKRLESRELSNVADRHIHSGLEERELAASLKDRHLQDRLSEKLEARFGRARRSRASVSRGIPGLPEGVGLREAMLIQAIFGPPRARQPLRPGRTVTGAGR